MGQRVPRFVKPAAQLTAACQHFAIRLFVSTCAVAAFVAIADAQTLPAAPAGSPAPAASPAPAEPDFIVPSRPTFSGPAEFQKPGVLQLQYGYNGNFHTNGVSVTQDTPLALRFAVSRRLLLELDTDSPISQTSGGRTVTGEGDTQLAIQAVLQHQSEARPAVAVAYRIKFPTASRKKGLGTGRVDHTFTVFVSKNTHGVTLDFNAIYLLAGRASRTGWASSGQAALAVSRGVTKRLGVTGEISGVSRNDQTPGSVVGMGVLTYRVNRRLALDGGVRVGLTPAAPRVGVVAGVTVGVAELFR